MRLLRRDDAVDQEVRAVPPTPVLRQGVSGGALAAHTQGRVPGARRAAREPAERRLEGGVASAQKNTCNISFVIVESPFLVSLIRFVRRARV